MKYNNLKSLETKVGQIDMFLSRENVPETHVELEGGSLIGSNYPVMKQILLQYPHKYFFAMSYDKEADLINIVDWSGYYVRHDHVNVGKTGIDPMRGVSDNIVSNNGSLASGTGAFITSDSSGISHNDSDYLDNYAMSFDSYLEIDGEKEHIDSVTEPIHKNVIFAMVIS